MKAPVNLVQTYPHVLLSLAALGSAVIIERFVYVVGLVIGS